MDLFLVICQGAGLAAACGIRPFLPALLTGALATADQGVDFDGTDAGFLEGTPLLAFVVVALVVAVVVARRDEAVLADGPAAATLAGIAAGIGGLLFAGSLADEGHALWPGLLAGVVCALLVQAATRGLLRRAGARLDPGARAALPVYADGASLVLAAVAILLPPLSLVALVFFAFLLVRGRGRDDEKYAGLRSLR